MTDIVTRAENALAASWDARSDTQRASLVPELVAELKAARAETERPLIETYEQLAALPFLALVREKYHPSPGSGCDYGGVWEMRTSGWHCLAGSLMPPGHEKPRLPAVLLWDGHR